MALDILFLPSTAKKKMVLEPQPKPHSKTFANLLGHLRNISPTEDPLLEVPLRLLLSITAFSALYAIARIYVFLEDIIGLRSLAASAYINVDWSQYIPHL